LGGGSKRHHAGPHRQRFAICSWQRVADSDVNLDTHTNGHSYARTFTDACSHGNIHVDAGTVAYSRADAERDPL
jgi:hypothetical protein